MSNTITTKQKIATLRKNISPKTLFTLCETYGSEEIENQISLYINQMLGFCTGNFDNFLDSNITSGEVNSKTTIKDDRIILNVKFPLSVTRNGKTYIIENFEGIEIPTRLNVIYDSIEELIKEQLNHDNICLSCITNIALKNDLTIDMTGIEDATLFTVKDEYLKINGVPLEWKFANKY